MLPRPEPQQESGTASPLEQMLADVKAKAETSILVVDDLIYIDIDRTDPEVEQAYFEHVLNEEALRGRASRQGRHLWIDDGSHERLQARLEEGLFSKQYDAIFINAERVEAGQLFPVALAQSLKTLRIARRANPDAQLIYLLPQTGPVGGALHKVLSTFLPEDVKIEAYDRERFPTLMHLLAFAMHGRCEGERPSSLQAAQHRYKNSMWGEQYLPMIDSALRAGNSQTRTPYHFLVLSDRQRALLGENEPQAEEKVRVENGRYSLTDEDLRRCAAIFIDNHWQEELHKGALGEGIATLRRIRHQLDEAAIDIPIIYQSGHERLLFSEKEWVEVEELGAVLATKDLFPKVCQGEERYRKERLIGELVEEHPGLARYTAHPVDSAERGLGRDGLFVLCTRIVDDQEQSPDPEKEELFSRLELDSSDGGLHRIYVLAQFHSFLRPADVEGEGVAPQFRPFHELVDRFDGLAEQLDEERVQRLGESYFRALQYEELHAVRCVAHNDAKWDNWFGPAGQEVLGDMADVAVGNEYRDLARAMLDSQPLSDAPPERVEELVAGYCALRRELDPAFIGQSEVFAKNIYGALLIESFREASKRSAENPSLSRNLLTVALRCQEYVQ